MLRIAEPFAHDAAGLGDELAPATVSAFRLDRHEVTVGRYRHFARGAKCSAYATWTDDPGPNEDLPISCVTWEESAAFCEWDGGRLPTEAEWNFAAAGGNEQRAYPWSAPAASLEIDATRAVFSSGRPAVVGSAEAGAGRWGHADLAGNVAEWGADWNGYLSTDCTDCTVDQPDPRLGSPAYRVVRGGGHASPATSLRTGDRGAMNPDARADFVGFRCAR